MIFNFFPFSRLLFKRRLLAVVNFFGNHPCLDTNWRRRWASLSSPLSLNSALLSSPNNLDCKIQEYAFLVTPARRVGRERLEERRKPPLVVVKGQRHPQPA